MFDFNIEKKGIISNAYLELGITTFKEATDYVRKLIYKRNNNKDNILCLFEDNCGTCSTKHTNLKRLADENQITIDLYMGVFKMDANYNPNLADILTQYNLPYILEAHCYLKIDGEIIDFTKVNSKAEDFQSKLIEEVSIEPNQINDFKIAYHKKILSLWLKENPEINYNLNEFWAMREQAINILEA